MRIWFNCGFSLASIAQAMLAAEPGLEVCIGIAKGRQPKPGPTATWIEPNLAVAPYVDWVRAQIEQHGVDILIPTRRRVALADAALPCRVEVAATAEVLDLLDDKAAFAEAIADLPYHLLARPIASVDALSAALAAFDRTHSGALPCVKPRRGVNGVGFWKLTRSRPTSHLDDPDGREIHRDQYLSALAAREREGPIGELVLMEYLPGPEVSFDILAHHGRLLSYAARTKRANGNQRIQTSHPLAPQAIQLVERFGLHGVVNAQFRRHADSSWKLLEINARPAGGSIYAESVGARLLADWAGLLTGRIGPDAVVPAEIDTEVGFTTMVDRAA